MKNKIIMKNRKVRFVFKDVDDVKFRKIHKYLTHLKDINSVKKMMKVKRKLEAPVPEEVSEHEDYEEEYSS